MKKGSSHRNVTKSDSAGPPSPAKSPVKTPVKTTQKDKGNGNPAKDGAGGAKRDLAKMALAAAMARPPVEEMLVRFAQRLGARQVRGNITLVA